MKNYKATIWARQHGTSGAYFLAFIEVEALNLESAKGKLRDQYEIHAFCSIKEENTKGA